MKARQTPPRPALLAAIALFAAACSGSAEGPATTSPEQESTSPEQESTVPGQESTTPEQGSTAPEQEPTGPELPPDLRVVTRDWETDFSTASIDLEELAVGIRAVDPRDLIPPIDEPAFETPATADAWLADDEPGLLVEHEGVARFYPLSILHRHEIVNDELGSTAVAVTYCPLCNTGLAFDRTVDGTTLRLGVSGLLRNSDLVMWDDATQSLWQQITGEAIVGSMTGTTLEALPSSIVRWADARDTVDDLEVLGSDQGFGIGYGQNPYPGYSTRAAPIAPFVSADYDDRFDPLERVVGVTVGDADAGYPFPLLSEVRAVNDEVGGVPVAVFWGAPSTADALDAFDVASGRAVGTGVAFDRRVDGTTLTFDSPETDVFVDRETGSTWTLQGLAVDGPLAGSELELLPHRNEFWFAFSAFFPGAAVWEG